MSGITDSTRALLGAFDFVTDLTGGRLEDVRDSLNSDIYYEVSTSNYSNDSLYRKDEVINKFKVLYPDSQDTCLESIEARVENLKVQMTFKMDQLCDHPNLGQRRWTMISNMSLEYDLAEGGNLKIQSIREKWNNTPSGRNCDFEDYQTENSVNRAYELIDRFIHLDLDGFEEMLADDVILEHKRPGQQAELFSGIFKVAKAYRQGFFEVADDFELSQLLIAGGDNYHALITCQLDQNMKGENDVWERFRMNTDMHVRFNWDDKIYKIEECTKKTPLSDEIEEEVEQS